MTIEELDRGILYHLETKAAEAGYCPDIYAFWVSNDDAGYQSAVAALGASFVNILGVGSFRDAKDLKANNIVIRRMDMARGDVQYATRLSDWRNEGGNFTEYVQPQGNHDIEYEIRVVTKTTNFERKTSQLILDAFGRESYLPGITKNIAEGIRSIVSTTERFFFRYQFGSDIPGADYIEKVFRFEAKGVYLEKETVGFENMAPLQTTITVQKNNTDGTPSEDSPLNI